MADKKYTQKSYRKGSVLWMENSKALPYFFIVRQGTWKRAFKMGNREEVTVIREGETFGLIACLTGHNHIDSLIALSDSLVIQVHKNDVIPFLITKKDIFLKILADYSNQLRIINQKLFALCSKSMYQLMPEHLLEIAEYFRKKNQQENYYYAIEIFLPHCGDEALREKLRGELASRGKLPPRPAEQQGLHRIYRAGEIIFLEQEKGSHFYFVEKGKVKISHIDRNHEHILAVLPEGEIFGEMSILNSTVRNASAVAFEETRLLVLNAETFMDKLGDKILQKIFTSLARRIWYSFKRALNLSYANPSTRLYDCLDFIMQSHEGQRKGDSYQFDINITDLRVLTNTMENADKEIEDFLKDPNININYGLISIKNLEQFQNIYRIYLNKELI